MARRTIKVVPPGEIDGTPDEVAAKASAQLNRALRAVGELAEQTEAQARNATMQAVIDGLDPEQRELVEPPELWRAWAATDLPGHYQAIQTAIRIARRASAECAKAH